MKRPNVEPWLQANMAALVVAGSVALDLGQQTLTKSLVTGTCAVASLILTDWLGIFRLHRALANLAALVALSYGMWEFISRYTSGLDPLRQLLSIANLLIYLQIILLFQKKDVRKYWLLAVLSLLEIVVASALNLGPEFGALLVVYLILSATGMAFFFAYRESLRLAGEGQGLDGEGTPASAARTSASEFAGGGSFALAGGGMALVRRETVADVQARLMSVRLMRPAFAMAATSLAFGALVFFSLPRMAGQSWHGRHTGESKSIGFSDQITLDEMSPLLHSDEKVMRIAFSDPHTGAPYSTIGAPYIRGAVLTKYVEGADGKLFWTTREPINPREGEDLPLPPLGLHVVRQDILLEPSESSTLFSVFDPYRLNETNEKVKYLHRTGSLLRRAQDEDERVEPFRYTLGVGGFDRGLHDPIRPLRSDVNWSSDPMPALDMHRERKELIEPFSDRQNGYERFPRLVEKAREILREADMQGGLAEEKARALTLHFLQSGEYTYTTDFSDVPRDPTLDPIEDFLVNHKSGHCEYFAGALCLMLRSQGIPARIVVGYRPDEFNPIGNYFQVRQRDAHAWVEALLWPHEITSEDRPAERTVIGAYLRLDPTPLSSGDGSTAAGRWMDRSLQFFDYAQLLWTDYVISMNSETQREQFFDPLSENASEAVDQWGIAARIRAAIDFVVRSGPAIVPVGALVVAIAGALFYLYHRRRPEQGSRRRNSPRLPDFDPSAKARPLGRFFAALSDLLEAVADERQPGETVAEWIARAERVWQAAPGISQEEPAFGESLALYHERRFGARAIDENRASALRTRLIGARETWLRRMDANPA
ncbi:MAG TPA: DUF3488 and transglutaminase-like domain-containing protein [Pirellulaceae bacterium]|jgi:hypothetical protein|nr:DUF3488 and transglutaminase-like domain-containing protein [Pirellulaceae bacterium]